MLKREERMNALNKAGQDTSKYFTLVVNDDIAAGSRISISVESTREAFLKAQHVDNKIANQIIEDGYVRNTRLHRRFIAAQYMRMLESDLGWHGYLNSNYGYEYQFDMMFEEVRVLSKLEVRDRETFNERRQFFTFYVVAEVLNDYINDVKKYLNTLRTKNCKGKPYIRIARYGNVFVDEIDKRIINPLEAMALVCSRTRTYGKLYDNLIMFKELMVALPWGTKKSSTWVNAFQGEGAYYTLKNLIMFHDVALYYDKQFYDKYNGMEVLNNLAGRYEGYQMNALLKKTIVMNNFDFRKSIEEHK